MDITGLGVMEDAEGVRKNLTKFLKKELWNFRYGLRQSEKI
jgi:hypothetical protein